MAAECLHLASIVYGANPRSTFQPFTSRHGIKEKLDGTIPMEKGGSTIQTIQKRQDANGKRRARTFANIYLIHDTHGDRWVNNRKRRAHDTIPFATGGVNL